MRKSKMVYEENQIFWSGLAILLLPNLILSPIIIYSFLEWEMFLPAVIMGAIPCMMIILVFYKIAIKIDNDSISLSYGAGIHKKVVSISEIDRDSIRKTTIPWYKIGSGKNITGIGRSVELTSKSEKHMFASSNPDKVIMLLNNLTKHQNR